MSQMEPTNDDQLSSLDSSLENESPDTTTPPAAPPPKWNLGNKKLRWLGLGLGIILIIAGFLALSHGKKPTSTIVINTQNLDAGTLSKLESQNKTTHIAQLTITPNTLFKNNVGIQGNLSVDGTAHLQGAVTTGSDLAVGGSLTVGGSSNLGGNLSVSGLITASGLSVGTLTISNLHLNGDLAFSGHLLTTGLTPTVQTGVTAGSGAKVTISGSDSSGVVTITTGSGPAAGELAEVIFHSSYKLAPHVQLTPTNSDTAISQYYVSPSATGFTVNVANTPQAGTIYSYDYSVSQ